ncbi:nuclear transport factor 2 family protein [Advenella kashmirensis]
MNMNNRVKAIAYVAVMVVSSYFPASASTTGATTETVNSAIVQQAFQAWKQGQGSVFDLLTEDAQWTVAGYSPVSDTYRSRDSFIDKAVRPITAKLATPITPEVKHIVAQADQVMVIWDGVATAKNGQPYENSYAWHLTMADGKITHVNAFLDTWKLVQLME